MWVAGAEGVGGILRTPDVQVPVVSPWIEGTICASPGAHALYTTTTWIWIAALTIAFEAGTCWLRFGHGFTSREKTRLVGRFTRGIRIHHGYVGLVMMAIVASAPNVFAAEWAWRIGWALFLSDAIHHFLVLWPLTGSPEFDLTYAIPEAEPVLELEPITVPIHDIDLDGID